MEYHAKGPGIEPNSYTEQNSQTYYPTHVNYVEGLDNKIAEVIKYNDVVGDKLEKDANAVSATKLKTARTLQTNLASTAAVNFDGTSNASIGVTGILPVANGGTGANSLSSVTVGTATKLETARNIQTNLASTTAGSFNGTASVSAGVTGILPVANGGTGQSNLSNVTVGAASKATLDSAGNNISTYYGKKFTSTALTLTKANWKTDTAETSDYKYYYEVTVSGLTTADLVEVFYSRASMNTVLEAGICPSSNDSMSGKFRIYAAAIPTANINATYVVWKG